MKATNEQNRKQKDFLDKLELRIFGEKRYEGKQRAIYCRKVLSGRYEIQIPKAANGISKAGISVPVQNTLTNELLGNRKKIKLTPHYGNESLS